jgi:hypothetical protein
MYQHAHVGPVASNFKNLHRPRHPSDKSSYDWATRFNTRVFVQFYSFTYKINSASERLCAYFRSYAFIYNHIFLVIKDYNPELVALPYSYLPLGCLSTVIALETYLPTFLPTYYPVLTYYLT